MDGSTNSRVEAAHPRRVSIPWPATLGYDVPPELIAFWVSFPDDPDFPMGFGITAWSREDAFRLLEEQGYDFHARARTVQVRDAISVNDLDEHVRPNMGPIVVRGVWYPCFNVGFGARRR